MNNSNFQNKFREYLYALVFAHIGVIGGILVTLRNYGLVYHLHNSQLQNLIDFLFKLKIN